MTRSRDEGGCAALREELLRCGVDPGGDPVALVQALLQRVGKSARQDGAIADLLGQVEAPQAVAALLDLEKRARSAQDRLAAKAARRSLYRLSQRGLPTPPRQAPAGVPIHWGLAPKPTGFLSPIDGAGGRLCWIARPAAAGVLLLSTAINEPLGMEEAFLVETTTKQLRVFRQELALKHGLHLIEADWRYVDALCQQAFERASKRGVKEVSHFPALRRRLTAEPAPPVGPAPVCALLDRAAIAGDESALARSQALFDEPEMAGWLLPAQVREAYANDLEKLMDCPLVLSPEQKRERIEELAAKCAREVFSQETAIVYARRLEEMSYHFLRTEREGQARAALAAALALGSSTTAEKIPFCQQLVKRTIGSLLLQKEEREREQAASSVLIRPGRSQVEPKIAAALPAGKLVNP